MDGRAGAAADDIERPVTGSAASCLGKPVCKGPLVHLPRSGLDLDHVDADDELVDIVHQLTVLVEFDARRALRSALTSMETCGGVIQGRTCRQERVGLDGSVYLVLVSVDMNLPSADRICEDDGLADETIEVSGDLFDNILPPARQAC